MFKNESNMVINQLGPASTIVKEYNIRRIMVVGITNEMDDQWRVSG